MDDEQVGKYIRLLCMQHQKGHLPEKDMLKICKSYDEDIFCKFTKDESGLYYNVRLDEEVQKRINYSESRRNNRKKKEDMKNICKTYDEHMENENENENTIDNVIGLSNTKRAKISKKVEPPDILDFLNYAEENSPVEFWRIEEQVKLKYKAWVEAGWHNGHGKKIINWKTAILNTLPHFKPINNGINQTNPNRPAKIGSMPIDEVAEFLNRDRSEYLTGTTDGGR